ncbi:unnamed protein product [Amoebophrya sp. A120]|nr:unnamed protein product [Amoebophrya sp. A120]|eukprot:GSA120T00020974001.1
MSGYRVGGRPLALRGLVACSMRLLAVGTSSTTTLVPGVLGLGLRTGSGTTATGGGGGDPPKNIKTSSFLPPPQLDLSAGTMDDPKEVEEFDRRAPGVDEQEEPVSPEDQTRFLQAAKMGDWDTVRNMVRESNSPCALANVQSPKSSSCTTSTVKGGLMCSSSSSSQHEQVENKLVEDKQVQDQVQHDGTTSTKMMNQNNMILEEREPQTALEAAAASGNFHLVYFLVENGADPLLGGKEGNAEQALIHSPKNKNLHPDTREAIQSTLRRARRGAGEHGGLFSARTRKLKLCSRFGVGGSSTCSFVDGGGFICNKEHHDHDHHGSCKNKDAPPPAEAQADKCETIFADQHLLSNAHEEKDAGKNSILQQEQHHQGKQQEDKHQLSSCSSSFFCPPPAPKRARTTSAASTSATAGTNAIALLKGMDVLDLQHMNTEHVVPKTSKCSKAFAFPQASGEIKVRVFDSDNNSLQLCLSTSHTANHDTEFAKLNKQIADWLGTEKFTIFCPGGRVTSRSGSTSALSSPVVAGVGGGKGNGVAVQNFGDLLKQHMTQKKGVVEVHELLHEHDQKAKDYKVSKRTSDCTSAQQEQDELCLRVVLQDQA